MPLVPVVPVVPTPPAAPHIVPPSQRVTPVEPARRVVAKKDSGKTDLESEDKRRTAGEHHPGDRGGLFDVEA